MTADSLAVLVVDDDFRVAELHSRYVVELRDFQVVGRARTGSETIDRAAALAPDLVLLDNYLPDVPGVSVAARLACDVIMVTADNSPTTIRAAFAAGALNYVIKPFPARLLQARLTAYARYREALDAAGETAGQHHVDRAVAALHAADRALPAKGRSAVTARLVAERLAGSDDALTAVELATDLGISRATAQRYLASLIESGQATMSLRYGTTGRPEHRYSWVG